MRPNLLTRTLVTTTVTIGLAVGSLAGASAGWAAPAQDSQQTVTSEIAPLAVANLGLSTTQAKYVQLYLKNSRYGYTGAIDGIAGSGTKAAFKNYANSQAWWC